MIVCVDVDHTLRHSTWRDDHIAEAMRSLDWDLYHSMGVEDKPALSIVSLVIALKNSGHEIYIVTAIPRKWMRQLFSWLHKAGILVEQDHILMRPFGDDQYRPSPELKLELVKGLDVGLMIEDREDVVLAFHKAGIPTIQVRLVS